MQFLLDDSSDPNFYPAKEGNWQHWTGLQVYGGFVTTSFAYHIFKIRRMGGVPHW